VIDLLVQFGFKQDQADAIFARDVWDYNVRSRRAFEKAGFRIVSTRDAEPGSKGRLTYDLAIFRNST
jgi:RimJ/RimL family protein N-acetyltransferase